MSELKKSVRMAPLRQLEEMKEQRQLKAFVVARETLQLEAAKLQQLLDYSREYENQATKEGRKGIYATRLQSYHKFISRLNDAVAQQEASVLAARTELQVKETEWLEQRGTAKSMANLIERFETQEKRVIEKQEQKTSDELSLARYRLSAEF